MTSRQVLNIAYNAAFLIQGQKGVGRHIWDVRAIDLSNIFKVCIWTEVYEFCDVLLMTILSWNGS